jgi:hypothetical protein
VTEVLQLLLEVMQQPKSVYVLGAGASAGLVPFTSDLRTAVGKAFAGLGEYPAERAVPSELFNRVVGGYKANCWDRTEAALQHITVGALELLVQKQLANPICRIVPAQYRLLRSVAAPSLFFSFNLDGLARAYLGDTHLVLEPHGSVDREWTESRNYNQLLEWVLDVELPHLRPKLLPGPEPNSISSTRPYVGARRWLRQARGVVLIGYSFGKGSRGRDDSESFEYMVEHLTACCGPVLVVAPDPFELAAAVEERVRAKRVLPVPLYWNVFSKVMSLPPVAGRMVRRANTIVIERLYLEALQLKGQFVEAHAIG